MLYKLLVRSIQPCSMQYNTACPLQICFRDLPRGGEGRRAKLRKCAQVRNKAQGEPLPKRDIVDTSFHASCAEGQGTATGTNLPTTWEKGTEQKQGAYRVRYQLGLHCTRATMDGDTKGTKWVLV